MIERYSRDSSHKQRVTNNHLFDDITKLLLDTCSVKYGQSSCGHLVGVIFVSAVIYLKMCLKGKDSM